MIDTVEVWLWGNRIGIIHQDEDAIVPTFEYDPRFRTSGIELAPFKMPLSDRLFSFPELRDSSSFRGLPGLLADSLPDRFGNSVIDLWLERNGRKGDEMTPMERLCYTGKRGMGALEFVPSTEIAPGTEDVDITEMSRFASEILTGKADLEFSDSDVTASQMIDIGSSAGGSRAKAVIAWDERTGRIRSGQTELSPDFGQWLIKFDAVEGNGDHGMRDGKQYTLIEYSYHLMAKDLGIDMAECRLLKKDGLSHFMTRRFDRSGGKKIFVQTLSALEHVDFNLPGRFSYESYAGCARDLGLGMNAVQEIYRRMAFNALAFNCDDHVKNFSFIMDRNGDWSLSPAYDLTFAYSPDNRWLKGHQMLINGKSTGITHDDLMASGRRMGLSDAFCKNAIRDTKDVVSNWPDYAERCGINRKTVDHIRGIIG